MDVQQIQQLVTLVENSQIFEIDLHDSEQRKRIRVKNAFVKNAMATETANQNLTTPSPQSVQQTHTVESIITSTQVGWLQLAPDTGSADKISIGDSIVIGEVVAWVSVMDRLLPIESKKAGTVRKILVENKQAVEYGTALFELT